MTDKHEMQASGTRLHPRGPAIMACVLLACCAIHLQAATFNARDYGAVGDDKTDNTAAFSKCIAAIVAAGGGKMFIPDGVYRGRIIIPPVPKPLPSWMTLAIVGESAPTPVFGTIGNFPLRDQGTILKCVEKEGPGVITAVPSTKALYANFSAVNVVIRNLDVRTCDDPRIGGIDLGPALQCRLENVFINTGVYNVQASKPTHATKGLVTPANNNAALTLLRNMTVTGYHTGIVVNEHTHGDHIVLGSNIHGLEFASANHASRFDRVSAMRNTHHVTVSGRHGFSIEQLNIENAGSGQTDTHNEWQKVIHDMNDPNNLGTGDITYWVVLGKTWVKNAARKALARAEITFLRSPEGVTYQENLAAVDDHLNAVFEKDLNIFHVNPATATVLQN